LCLASNYQSIDQRKEGDKVAEGFGINGKLHQYAVTFTIYGP